MMLPAGTTSNESLHAKMNSWFLQTQGLHQTTLKIKLSILTLSKLLSHNAALYSPTAAQLPSSQVLARRLGQGLWTKESWASWAACSLQKANLPMGKHAAKRCSAIERICGKAPCFQNEAPRCEAQDPFQPHQVTGHQEGWRT
jgi:hypothetical protein